VKESNSQLPGGISHGLPETNALGMALLRHRKGVTLWHTTISGDERLGRKRTITVTSHVDMTYCSTDLDKAKIAS